MNKSFEDQWKDALRDASQTPPPDIWSRVEQELDKKEKRGFILWKNPRLLSGAAAAVLLVLSTLYFSQQTAPLADLPKSTVPTSPELQEVEESTSAYAMENHLATNTTVQNSIGTEKIQETLAKHDTYGITEEKAAFPAEMMQALAYEATSASLHLPNVEVAPAEKELLENKAAKKKWVAIAAQNSGFQPNFSAPGLQQAALSAAVNSSNLIPFDKTNAGSGEYQLSNTNRSDINEGLTRGQSFSFGLGIGNKFKNKWGWETGLKYTHATAFNNSNVYVFDKATGKTDSYFHANYVNDANPSDEFMVSVNSKSKYSYHFLAVPVLLNYDVLQVGQFKVQAVAGISGEWFMGGKVESDNGSEKLHAGNSKYKALSLAGVGGLRLSYPITQTLDLQLGGQYQHFLTSGLENTGDATLRPSMMGIHLGLSVRR
jgi:hypothetical protein